jgi:hypothetical protein
MVEKVNVRRKSWPGIRLEWLKHCGLQVPGFSPRTVKWVRHVATEQLLSINYIEETSDLIFEYVATITMTSGHEELLIIHSTYIHFKTKYTSETCV